MPSTRPNTKAASYPRAFAGLWPRPGLHAFRSRLSVFVRRSQSVRLCLFGANGIGGCGASVIIIICIVQFNEMDPASKDPAYLAKAVRLAVAYNPHSPTL